MPQRIWLHGRGLRVSAATLGRGDVRLALAYTEVDTMRARTVEAIELCAASKAQHSGEFAALSGQSQ